MLHSVSLAERIAYGRPADPIIDDTPVRVADRPKTALVGRVLLAAIFVMSGIAKLTDTAGTVAHMEAAGVPAADVLAVIAGIGEIAGGLALVFGFLTRIGALGLIAFMIPTTIIFHGFWRFEGAEQELQMIQFMKNLAILGGLFTVLAYGPGRHSVDKKIREPIQP
ncbi:MAG TPA: DoxX family protein [Kofleriaceae bacterium]|nr:DoxX family protein [Kofleriaceae bacterium]